MKEEDLWMEEVGVDDEGEDIVMVIFDVGVEGFFVVMFGFMLMFGIFFVFGVV